MRVVRVLAVVAAAFSVPGVGFAQTKAYVCTPTAQVIEQSVNADGSAAAAQVLFTGTGAFDDCVLGPDGWLYVANGSNILRLDPANPATAAASAVYVNPTPLPSTARGLAFNVSTLYVNTATAGIWTLAGTRGPADPLLFASSPAPLLAASAGGGHGLAFDVLGNLALASGTALRRATVATTAPHYFGTPAVLFTSTDSVGGVAVNTCGEIVFTDKATQSVRRRLKDGTISALPVVSFAGTPDYPVAIEIDARNTMFIVTAQFDDGSKGKLWRAAPAGGGDGLQSCASASATVLLDIRGSLLEGVVSSAALGVAVPRRNVSLTRSFNAATCTQVYDFGYHTVRLGFASCAVPFDVTIEALATKPSLVGFTFDATARGIPYSPLGGDIVQYVLNAPAGAGDPAPYPFQAQYGFYTQQIIGMPGVARASAHAPDALFTESVMSDFWDVGILDAAGGERGDDFSKRVLFHARPAAASCASPVFETPLQDGKPLFNSGQNIKIAFTATTQSGAACGRNGTLRVSVVRIEDGKGNPALDFVTVRSTSKKPGNVMTTQGSKYSFNLDTTGYDSGTYLITIWGDTVAPITKLFEMER